MPLAQDNWTVMIADLTPEMELDDAALRLLVEPIYSEATEQIVRLT